MITSAKYLRNEQVGSSTYIVIVELTDDVTGIKEDRFTVSGATLAEITADIRTQLAARNAELTRKSVLDGIAPGTNIPVTAPAPAVPTAKQQFYLDARRLQRMKATEDAGVTGLSSAITTLAGSLNTRLTANPTWADEF